MKQVLRNKQRIWLKEFFKSNKISKHLLKAYLRAKRLKPSQNNIIKYLLENTSIDFKG